MLSLNQEIKATIKSDLKKEKNAEVLNKEQEEVAKLNSNVLK